MNLTFALSCAIAAMWLLCGKCDTSPDLVSDRRLRNRPLYHGYTIEGLLAEDEDAMTIRKRQHQFDDYGHMRFGKREQFDDYGHMRFGRNHE